MVQLSNCSCDTHPKVSALLNLEICNAPIVGAWVLAVLVGAVVGGRSLAGLGLRVRGAVAYAITFYAYAIMITSGLVVHSLYLVECWQQQPTSTYLFFVRLDGGLTSCIAISFLFNGLIDVGLISEEGLGTIFAMIFSYGWIIYTYFSHLSGPIDINIYKFSILIGCGGYGLLQMVRVAKYKLWKYSILLLFGVLVGGGSFFLLFEYPCWLCTTFGAWSLEGLWYYGSDISMFLVFLFVWYTRPSSAPADMCSYQKHSKHSVVI